MYRSSTRRDFALDRSTNQLFWVNETDGSVYTNQIYWLDITNPTVLHPLLQQSQFPITTDASPFPNGYITAVDVDPSTDLVYFTTHSQHPSPDATYNAATDKIYWISETATGSTAATALTISGLPALFYPGKITFDMATRQIYVVSEQNDTGAATSDDVIYVLQLDASGHSASLINTLTISNPAFLQDAASVGGMTFDALAEPRRTRRSVEPCARADQSHAADDRPDHHRLRGRSPGKRHGQDKRQLRRQWRHIVGRRRHFRPDLRHQHHHIGHHRRQRQQDADAVGLRHAAPLPAGARDVRFNANSENPTNSGSNTTRTITWQVNDGAIGNPSGTSNTTNTNVRTTTITVERSTTRRPPSSRRQATARPSR